MRWVLAMLAVLVACGGDDDGAGGDGGAEAAQQGRVWINQELIEPDIVAHANASFQAGAGCEVETYGECTVCRVDLTAPPDDGLPLDAGTITLTGADLTAPIELVFDRDLGAYDAFLGSDPLFEAGQTIDASSTGGEVAAFSDVSVETPGEVALTAPSCADGDCADLDRSADLAVTWTGGGAGDVEVSVTTTDNTEASVVVFCTFDAGAHEGTVPAAAMALLQESDRETVFGQLVVAPTSAAVVPAGDWDVRFSVTATRTFGTFATSN